MNADKLSTELHLISSQKKDLLDKSVAMLQNQKAEIEALYKLIKEQDKKIIQLSFDKVYAERSNELKKPYNNAVGKTIEGGAELVCDSFVDFSKWISPVKTLTNDEILCLWDYWSGEILAIDILDFADKYRRAILNEQGIIEWHQKYCKKMNEEDAKKVDTYKSQNNNQIDTYRYKNLTDEEIEQLIKQHDWYSKTWVDMVRFIESAILRKAQEK
jgi:hypothetical protein